MTARTRAPAPEVSAPERTAESRRRADRARAAARAEQAEPSPEQVSAPRVDYSIGNMPATPPADNATAPASTTGEETVEQPQLPPVPEPGVTAEEVASRQEQIEAAQASLDGAQDTPALMNAFATAPPTIKAQVSGELGSRTSGTLNQETAAITENTPDISVEMQGNTPAPAGTIEAPAVTEIDLEPAAPEGEPEAEAIVGEPIATEGDYDANTSVTSLFARSFNAESGAEDVERALDNVQTSDPSIATSPGSPPPVPQEGETDPARFENQRAEGDRLAAETLAQQQAAAQALPGVERVQLADVHETHSVGELVPPTAEEAAAPEGAQQYLNYNQPPEVQTAFDDITGAQMQQSMAEAQAQVDAAAQERDTQHQTEVESAQQQANDARDQANRDQQAHVSEAERSIETQRQSTAEQQQVAVENMQQEAETRRASDRSQFDDRVQSDQQQIDQRYTQAETDAANEVQQGEREAEAERARAERESEDQSWWEAALDFITDLFDALVAAINSIFDAVRAAVNAILDAVRDFAIGLIQLAAEALKGLIEAFGEFLKGLVNALLADIFPELARVLTEAIDSAVSVATSAIDAVANWLIEAVNAIVEALRAALMKLIDIYQAAVNTALALARAALTGDWTGFIIQLIEAACRVAGIDPQQIFEFLGRARETIQIIVDDPFAFLSNLIDALVGGVRLFADNFVTHLQAGIINWLTGTIGGAGITLPERWDLMGVISLIGQILGLTWENLRVRLVRLVGERGVQVLEFVAGYVEALISGGWSGLWEKIKQDLTSIKDIVFEQIRNYLVERIIVNAIMYLATLWEPIGWLVNFLIATYRFIMFIRDQFQRIVQMVTMIFDAVGNIARGILQPAQQSVEGFLANLLPLAIDLLARLLGLGNIGGRVREIITGVQEVIWGAIDKLIAKVIGLFKGGGAAGATPTPETAIAGAGAAAGQIGERVPIPTQEDGTHTLYIVRTERGSNPMVESTPMTVSDRLTHWEKPETLEKLTDEEQPQATTLLGQAKDKLTELDTNAGALAKTFELNKSAGTGKSTGDSSASTQPAPASSAQLEEQVKTNETELAVLLKSLFDLFKKVDADPDEGALEKMYPTEVAMAHPKVQKAMRESMQAMVRRAKTDGVQLKNRYRTWDAVRYGKTIGLESKKLEGAKGAAMGNLLEAPFNLHMSPSTTEFSEYVDNTLLVAPLQAAYDDAEARGAEADYPGLEEWDDGKTGNVKKFVTSRKGDMNQKQGRFTRSLPQMIAMIFNASMETPAKTTFLDELVGAALSAETSVYHEALSADDVKALVATHFTEMMGRGDADTLVAVFAAAGRAITATRTDAPVKQDTHLTLEILLGADIQDATDQFAAAIEMALKQSADFMTLATALNMSAADIRQSAAEHAEKIMSTVKGQPLYFVRPTDVPRDVSPSLPYVKVREVGGQRLAVAPALYGKIAEEISVLLNLKGEEIHHILPLYLGGGHEIYNLAVVYGAAAKKVTPHGMLHKVIDAIDISSYINTNGAKITLRVPELAKVYTKDLKVLLGVLRTDGRIEWKETDKTLNI